MVRVTAHPEELLGAVVRAAAEVVTFEELGREVMPLLRRAISASSTHLYRSEPEHPMLTLAGDALAELMPDYLQSHFEHDPLQHSCTRHNPWIWVASRYPEWQQYVNGPIHDFCARWGVKYILHMRLFDGAHLRPGMVGIAVARSPRQPDFTDDEVLKLAQLMPSLQAAARRCERTRRASQVSGALQGLLEDGRLQPRMALDLGARLLWASPRAERLLGRRRTVPEELETAVRRLAAFAGRAAPATLAPFTAELRAPEGTVVKAHLSICHGPTGEPFIAVDLDVPLPAPPRLHDAQQRAGALTERHGLTPAEAGVLRLLAGGLRDRDIARQQHTSLSTVRTHVSRVLGKLGVSSRLEAALLYSRSPRFGD
jgi:DNA-binding CsgD family transcriptional regulator